MLALPERSITTLDHIHHMDALSLLRALPSGFVDCVVTSPPYFGLRDYKVAGQIGLEDTPAEFIKRLMQVMREVYRVLKPTGTVWLNIGDSYANDAKWGGSTGGKHAGGLHGQTGIGRQRKSTGLPPKSLMMIPARLAISMQDEGWILRNDVIWSKPAPMPESAKDRLTRSHEHIFFFTKSARYWSDMDAVKEPAIHAAKVYSFNQPGKRARVLNDKPHGNEASDKKLSYELRNLRDVWSIGFEPTTEDHYASYPTEIPRRSILAGCPCGGIVLDPFVGTGTTALVAKQLGRHYIGCDLNLEYVAMSRKRLAQTDPYQDKQVTPELKQRSMFAAMTGI